MINVVLPSMGSSSFFRDVFFPKPLIELGNETMLEAVFNNFNKLSGRQLTYVFSKEDCQKFHLGESVKLLDSSANVVMLKAPTAGALCTSLFCVDYIENDSPLIISNSDQIIDVDFNEIVSFFERKGSDAGVIVFDSIHPRWSYIKLDDELKGIEVAEKRPLSNNAIAGFYYYKHGREFVHAAKLAILKQANVNGIYYISSSLNELILMGKKIDIYKIDSTQYHPFYSPEKIQEYIRSL